LFDRRQGRNQTFNSAGNVVAAVSMGLLGHFISNRSIFFFVFVLAFPTILSLLVIRPMRSTTGGRGARRKATKTANPLNSRNARCSRIGRCSFSSSARDVSLCQRPRCCRYWGEMLAKRSGPKLDDVHVSACVVTTQLVVTLLASWAGRKAGTWGRKPLLLIAFGSPAGPRCSLHAHHSTGELVAIQVLDGVAAAIFGVVSVLVIADLTKGTGRFNLTLGAIGTAVGMGASLSQVIAGSIVHRFGSNAGFLFLGAVAAAALGILYFFMPETRDKQFLKPIQGAPTL